MAKPIKIAAGLLRLPDGRVVLNRRDSKAPTSPNLLAFYGGHVDPGETTDMAIKREIGEETSLDVSKLSINYLGHFQVHEVNSKEFFIYEIQIEHDNFEVYEGLHSETLTRTEALKRPDITPSVRYALENIVKD